MKTVADYQNHMIHAIGGQPDSRIDLLDVLNEALRFLFDHHPWSFRGRPILEINATEGQTFIQMPDDMGELLSVHFDTRNVQLTSLEDIAHRRANTLIPPPLAAVYCALSFPGQSDTASEQGAPLLELFPVPTANDGYTVEYRAGAVLLTDDDQVPNIPPSFERVLALLARAFICDYEEQDSSREWDEARAELEAMKNHDALAQQNMGLLLGGAVNERRKRVNFWMGGINPR